VITNDPAQKNIQLSLDADVVKELGLQPASLYLGKVKKGEETVKTVRIEARDPKSLNLGAITSDNEQVAAKLVPSNQDGGVAQMIEVRFKAKEITAFFNAKVSLETGNPKVPKIELPVNGIVEGDIVVQPPRLYLFGQKDSKPVTSTLWLRSMKTFKISKITNDMKSLKTISSNVKEPGSTFKQETKIDVTYEHFEGEEPFAKGKIEIYTNNPDQKIIPVEITIRIGSGAARMPRAGDAPPINRILPRPGLGPRGQDHSAPAEMTPRPGMPKVQPPVTP